MHTRTTLPIAVIAALSLTAAGVALAAQSTTGRTTYSAGSAVSPSKGGTKARPVPVSVSGKIEEQGADGQRPDPSKVITFTWSGLRENGAGFPKCTADQIDAAQSTSVCPRGSRVGSGAVVGLAGPVSDPHQSFRCEKDLEIYNAGRGKVSWVLTGDSSKCAGVGYTPPTVVTWKNGPRKTTMTLPNPRNLSEPLPGVEAGATLVTFTFKKVTRTIDGKKVGYLSSVGCFGQRRRAFTLKHTDTSDRVATVKTTAGACKK